MENQKRENHRRTYRGIVVSDKSDKTIVVAVTTYKTDRLYGKRVKKTKKFHVHDEKNEAKIGDTVSFIGTRPLSKTKRFRLLKIVIQAEVIA